MTVKRNLKRRTIKHITKQTEKKRQENQKNEVITRKCKDKKKKKKENLQAAVDKGFPGVQARCAVFFLIFRKKIKENLTIR